MFCLTSQVSHIYADVNACNGYNLFFTDSDGESYKMRCNRNVFRFVSEHLPAGSVALVGFRIASGSPSFRIATAVYPVGGDFFEDNADAAFGKLLSGCDTDDFC